LPESESEEASAKWRVNIWRSPGKDYDNIFGHKLQ